LLADTRKHRQLGGKDGILELLKEWKLESSYTGNDFHKEINVASGGVACCGVRPGDYDIQPFKCIHRSERGRFPKASFDSPVRRAHVLHKNG
jgi:hypothetical protein